MDDLKKRIYFSQISRVELAARLNMPYSTFCGKLNGFNRFSIDEEKTLLHILEEVEAKAKPEVEVEQFQ